MEFLALTDNKLWQSLDCICNRDIEYFLNTRNNRTYEAIKLLLTHVLTDKPFELEIEVNKFFLTKCTNDFEKVRKELISKSLIQIYKERDKYILICNNKAVNENNNFRDSIQIIENNNITHIKRSTLLSSLTCYAIVI